MISSLFFCIPLIANRSFVAAVFIYLFFYSMALNFDDYTKGWGTIGTSMPSDAKDSRDK